VVRHPLARHAHAPSPRHRAGADAMALRTHRWPMADPEGTRVSADEAFGLGLGRPIDATIEAVASLSSVDGAACLLLDDRACLQCASSSTGTGRTLGLAEALTAEGPGVDAFLTGEPVTVDDLPTDHRYRRTAAIVLATDVRAVVAVPVLAGGHRVGAVTAVATGSGPGSPADMDAVRGAASDLGRLVDAALSTYPEGSLGRRIAAAIAHERVVDDAVQLLAARLGATPLEAARYLRQVSAALGRGVHVVSRAVVERGRPPDPHPDARAPEELAVLRHRFETAFENAPSGLALVGTDGTMMDLNPHLADLLGRPLPSLVDANIFDFIHPGDLPAAQQVWARVVGAPGLRCSEERRYVKPDGATVWVNAHQVLVPGDPHGQGHIVMQCQDVTAQRNAEEELRRMALHDPLTGLGNRTLLHDRISHALARIRRHPAHMCVIFLDLDRFKVINDSLGHDAGDDVLVDVAERLRSAARTEDTIARLGGDEFAVLCEDIDGPSEAREIGERLVSAARGPVHLGRVAGDASLHTVDVDVSVGVACAGAEHRRPADLLRDADLAMYSAKANGGGCVEVLSDRMRSVATRRFQLETALRAAVAEGRIDVVYQPIVRLADRATVGLEALARWHDPVHGRISPADFIPLAEEAGFIVSLGAHVLRRACVEVARWRRTYPGHAGLRLAVNVSARQLIHPEFRDTVRDAVADSAGAAANLTLEITESTLMQAAGPAMTAVDELHKELGVAIAIDDFGTGFSSLAYLTRLAADALKVDRAFVNGLAGADAEGTAVVSAILGLADSLGLRVTAEGVETEEQAEDLRSLGCEYAQGFLFSRPLASTQVPGWLAEARPGTACER
jgi:diguanylate cyclase (GGDEF)-like protein/PAS domain S-box-containing protein